MRTIALLAALFFAACDSPVELDDRWADPEKIEFADALGVDLTLMNKTASGLFWQDLVVRTDGIAVDLDDAIRFHYTMWLPDGTQLETTRGSLPHQSAVLLLLTGVAEGITGVSATGAAQDMPAMRPGSRRKLVIRPELAWGKRGNPPIPPLSTLIYDIEIIDFVR